MKPGDTAELAIWCSDSDDPRKIAFWKTDIAAGMFEESANRFGVMLGPARYYELQVGEGRAGNPPDKAIGDNVRLLVAECEVIGYRTNGVAPSRFTDDLKAKDRDVLRAITRKVYCSTNGHTVMPMTDEDCDKVIDMLGPEAAERALRGAVDATKH